MKTKKSQESQRLLDSVKEMYNDPGELELRIEDLKIGISEAEQAFVEKFPAGSRLLDIGCATGRLCFALARQGYNITGIDVAKKQIEQAQQIAEKERINATFLQYEMPTMPFPDASFAAAFMGNVYCYVPHRRRIRASRCSTCHTFPRCDRHHRYTSTGMQNAVCYLY